MTEKYEVSSSLFADGEVLEKEVELGDGKKHCMFFKELSHVQYTQWLQRLHSSDPEKRDQANSFLIAESLVCPDGSPAITIEKAHTLKPGVVKALGDVIGRINGFGEQGKG